MGFQSKPILKIFLVLFLAGSLAHLSTCAWAGVCGGNGQTKVDLLQHYPPFSQRKQDKVGACHAFGAVALLEEAIYRLRQEHVRLSEADLFVQSTVTDEDYYLYEVEEEGEDFVVKIEEANSSRDDLQFGLNHGVATTRTAPTWDSFLERYLKFRQTAQADMETVEEMRRQQNMFQKLAYNPRRHWADLRTEATQTKMVEDYLLATSEAAMEDRRLVRDWLAGSSAGHADYVDFDWRALRSMGGDVCRLWSQANKRVLLQNLCEGRSVGVSMNLAGLERWGKGGLEENLWHFFVITGVEEQGNGRLVFKTRNSWGSGKNHPVYEEDLCRVGDLVWVSLPGER